MIAIVMRVMIVGVMMVNDDWCWRCWKCRRWWRWSVWCILRVSIHKHDFNPSSNSANIEWETVCAGSSDFNWLPVVIENEVVGNLTFDTQSFETITKKKSDKSSTHILYYTYINTHTHVFLYIHILTCVLAMAGTALFFTFKLHMVIVIWMWVNTCEAYLGNRSLYHVNMLCVWYRSEYLMVY